MQESFALPHTADAPLLALAAACIGVLHITESSLAATESSTGISTLIPGDGKNRGLQFQGGRWLGRGREAVIF